MSEFLTRRGSTWHFVRRVPTEFAALDPHGIIRHPVPVILRGLAEASDITRIAALGLGLISVRIAESHISKSASISSSDPGAVPVIADVAAALANSPSRSATR